MNSTPYISPPPTEKRTATGKLKYIKKPAKINTHALDGFAKPTSPLQGRSREIHDLTNTPQDATTGALDTDSTSRPASGSVCRPVIDAPPVSHQDDGAPIGKSP